MSSPFNDNNDFEKNLKNKNVNKTTVITVITLLMAIVIVATAAIVSNRAKKTDPIQTLPSTQTPSDTTPMTEATDEQTEQPTEAHTGTSTEIQDNSSNVSNKIPSFILPTSGVLFAKHDPDLQVFSPTMNDYRVHLGIDITTNEDAPVYAAADGKISKIWVDPLMGYCIAISHSGNCITIYKNLSEHLPSGISEGASVRSGQLIATVGDSAMVEVAQEPHLHFEMTVGDLAVDPLKYFDDNALESIKANT